MKKIFLYSLLFLLIIQIKAYSQENSIKQLVEIIPQEVTIGNIGDEVVFRTDNLFLKGNEEIMWYSADTNIAEVRYSKICNVMTEDSFENNVHISVPCAYVQSKGEGETIITLRIKEANKIIKGQSKILVKPEKAIGNLSKLISNPEEGSYQKVADLERFFVRFDKSKHINKIVFKLSKDLPLEAKINILCLDQPNGGYLDLFNKENISKLNCNKIKKTCEINFFNKKYNLIKIEFLDLPYNESFLENMEIYGYD